MMKMQLKFISLTLCLIYVTAGISLPLESLDENNEKRNLTEVIEGTVNKKESDSSPSNITNSSNSSFPLGEQSLPLPTTLKPIHIHNHNEEETSREPMTTSAQNFFSTYYQPHIKPLGHSRPYYPVTEEPFLPRFLVQPRKKQYIQRPRLQTYTAYDPTLMGSGDFGILRGGTFYSNEETSYHEEDNTDFYYSAGSNSHSAAVTEGFIQKYTYPEEQFAQFRDFAELNTPADAAFSEYVVVYAAKNATTTANKGDNNRVPNNIFDQLQQIDEENAELAKKRRNRIKGLSSHKLKLIKTKVIKKKVQNKSKKEIGDEDPLLALS